MNLRSIGMALSSLALIAACRGGEVRRRGRTTIVPSPVGRVAIYTPASHDPARKWPLVVFLPAYEQPPDKWIKPWTKLADTAGFILAIPVPSKPRVSTGYPPVAPVVIARTAVEAAAADPERIAIVGHGSAGLGLSATAFAYPRLAAALVIIGSVPAPLTAPEELAAKMPEFHFLFSNKRIRAEIENHLRRNPKLRISTGHLEGAEGPFEAAFVNPVIAWIATQVKLGSRPAPAVASTKPDPTRSAKLTARSEALRARGAGAGAYICLLRAARLAPDSYDARLRLAKLSLEGRRLNEAIEWSGHAAGLKPRQPAPRLCAAEAWLKLGRARNAIRELEKAGTAGAGLLKRVRARTTQLEVPSREPALAAYRLAVKHMRQADYGKAAAAARQAVKAEPCEAAYRAMAVYAICNAEGMAAARKSLDDYLALFSDDPFVRPLADAISASATVRLNPGRADARISLLLGRILPVGPASGLLSVMAIKAGASRDPEELAKKLVEGGANRVLRSALPILSANGITYAIGSGTLADLRTKLDADIPVLVQLPPGELAGLRRTEKHNTGIPRLVVGYDDVAHCILLQDYAGKKPIKVPYALFDRLWDSLDRWWMAIPETGTRLPGLEGRLTKLELASALAAAGDLRAARVRFESELKASPRRARLGLGMVLTGLNDLPGARRHLLAIPAGDPNFDVQVAFELGRIEMSSEVGSTRERGARALPHFRRAWRLDPGSERNTIQLCAALLITGIKEDRREARNMLEDFLRYHPLSVPCLRLLYSQ